MWFKRKFLRFLLLFSLVFSMISLKNTCKAYTWEDFKLFVNDYTNYNDLSNDTKEVCNWVVNNISRFENKASDLNDYDNFIAYRKYNSRESYYEYYLWLFKGNNISYNSSSWSYSSGGQWRYIDQVYRNTTLRTETYTTSQNRSGFNGSMGLLEVEPNVSISNSYYYNYVYNYSPPPSISFNAYSDGNISVNYNGTSDSFLKFNISRSVPQWALGKLDGLSGDMRVDVKLNRYMNSEFTTLVGHAQWYGGQRTSSGGLSIATDGVVYIDNTMLYYNQGYYLTIDLEGENVDNYPLYFLPYASTATSGDLLSPLIDTNSDLEILQNLQELVNIQNIGAIYDDSFGNSGELLGNLDYNDYHDNYYYAYFSDIFEELHSILLSSGDRSISFGFMGTTINLNSSDFTTPNNAIKVFCNTFLTFALFMYLYKTCFHMFHKLQEGNLIGAMHTMTVDDESVYM